MHCCLNPNTKSTVFVNMLVFKVHKFPFQSLQPEISQCPITTKPCVHCSCDIMVGGYVAFTGARHLSNCDKLIEKSAKSEHYKVKRVS